MLENPGDRAFLEGDLPGLSRTDGLPELSLVRGGVGRSGKISTFSESSAMMSKY
jgi:hypothetical protein